jgi:light-regulated signal transduction histidine kinase (bacteriophytochrome)
MNADTREQQAAADARSQRTDLAQVTADSESQAAIERNELDITRLNEKLTISNEQLAVANADLEAFSYSVAHDLRSPIRQIAGFSKILLEEFGPQLPAEARRYLDKVTHGAKQMGALVDDLLHLAQVGRQPLALQLTPLNSIVAAALESLQAECAARTIEWQIGELCSVACDQGLMKQAFVNLLSNAIKYSRSRNLAVIEIGQLELDGEHVIFVRDNGVGFDMQYADKLFGVFQRLHSAAEFAGTGIGLATVERIIRKHGGRIWVQAEPDRGATFFFTMHS